MSPPDTRSHLPPFASQYASYVCYRNGLAPEALTSPAGRRLYQALRPLNRLHALMGSGPDLEHALVLRHRLIDRLLSQAIETQGIRQVIEIGAGLSSRGLRFARLYEDRGLCYIEGDAAETVARKRVALADAGARALDHHLVALDPLADDGPTSLDAVAAARLDPERGTAIITEGLISHLPPETAAEMWRRFARLLSEHPAGVYFCDVALTDCRSMMNAPWFMAMLSALSRGPRFQHFEDASDVAAILARMGFARTRLHTAGEESAPGKETSPALQVIEAHPDFG